MCSLYFVCYIGTMASDVTNVYVIERLFYTQIFGFMLHQSESSKRAYSADTDDGASFLQIDCLQMVIISLSIDKVDF